MWSAFSLLTVYFDFLVAAPPVVPSSPSRAPVAANPVSTCEPIIILSLVQLVLISCSSSSAPATRTLLARDFLTTTTDASAPGPTEPPNLLLSHERLSVAAKQLGMEAWQLQHILFKHGFVSFFFFFFSFVDFVSIFF